jgi:hypothetical protein
MKTLYEPGIALEQQLATVLCGTMGGEGHLSARKALRTPALALFATKSAGLQ